MFFLWGFIAFGLFMIYDLEQAKFLPALWHNVVRFFFSLGGIMLLLATTIVLWQEMIPLVQWGIRQVIFLFSTVFFLALFIYTLFFALPFQETYIAQCAGNQTYDQGMYALCRHPGVLWFTGCYFSLWLSFGGAHLFWMAIWYSFLNWCYVLLQDFFTFPRIFTDYKQYKQNVPFLLPNNKSFRKCISTLRKVGD